MSERRTRNPESREKNRLASARSRQRHNAYVSELEAQVSTLIRENETLKRQNDSLELSSKRLAKSVMLLTEDLADFLAGAKFKADVNFEPIHMDALGPEHTFRLLNSPPDS